MTHLEYLQAARRDFILAGPKGYYHCPASQTIGKKGEQRCVAMRALLTAGVHEGLNFMWLQEAWYCQLGEGMAETNERGYPAVVAAYDQLILTLAPSQTIPDTYPQEVVPA